ncbi:hypothetical protein LINPERHAP1_LOCUS29048 [Linum perenne]
MLLWKLLFVLRIGCGQHPQIYLISKRRKMRMNNWSSRKVNFDICEQLEYLVYINVVFRT